jgi:transposase-like protein
LLELFNGLKRVVNPKWHVDETYVEVRGRWMYLYRAIDSKGDTVVFWFSERRNLTAAKRLLARALTQHGPPERIVTPVTGQITAQAETHTHPAKCLS